MQNSVSKTIAISLIILASAFCPVKSQPQLIDKAEKDPDGINIPYEKYRMPNGLTVIINENHTDPVATVMITYKVGSDRETVGRSGFAHFFEHMMFQGSKHVADEEHFRTISEAGGNMNGNTTSDRTQYFNNIPSNQVEIALWLESDRMGYLLDSLTSKKFENQRATVKNEKFQNQVNQPYGLVDEFMGQTLYPYKHPYSWPVIGYVDDLDRATPDDVKNFFLRWYGPNNAILTVTGDVDTKQVLAWVEKYFGNFKAGPAVEKLKVPPVRLASDKYFSYKDKVYLPLTYRVYPTVPDYHKDQPAIEIMAEIMGGGNNSIFYQKFVKTEKAEDVSIGNDGRELAGEFAIGIRPFPPEDAMEDYTAFDKLFKQTDDSIKSTLAEFRKTGITDDAVQRVKAKVEASILEGAEGSHARAVILTEWEWKLGRPFNMKDELARYDQVTKEDVARVFDKYINGSGAAIVNVYPRVSDKDSVKSVNPHPGIVDKNEREYAGLSFVPIADTPDRWKKPEPQAPKIVKVPDYYKQELPNGLKIIGTKTTETPTVRIYLKINGGDLDLNSGELKKIGIAELTARLMNEGTKNYTTEKISAELDKLGSTVTFSADKTSTRASIYCLRKNLDATLKLFQEKLLNPGFDEKDFKRIKKQYKENLAQEKSDPNYLAGSAFNSLLYGNTIWGMTPTRKNVDKLDISDLKAYYDKCYSPSVSRIVVVGDVDQSDMESKLSFLNNWKAKDVKIYSSVSTNVIEPEVYIVDKIGAPSSIIAMGCPSIPYDATGDYFKCTVANFMLGGNFNSHLNQNLRENKGYTYGIFSGFRGDKYKGEFGIGAAVKRIETGNSLSEIMKELQNYLKNGVTDAEVEFTKNSILNREAMKYETNAEKASFLGQIAEYNLDKDFTLKQAQVLKSMTKEDFNAQMKKFIDPSKTAIVIVGDKVAIKKQLEALNINVKDFNEKLNLKKFKEIEVE